MVRLQALLVSCALCLANAAQAAIPRAGWALVNPPGDYAAQIGNQQAVLDVLRRGLAVYWVAGQAGLPEGLKHGNYVIPVQGGTAYIQSVLDELPEANRRALDGPVEFEGYELRFPLIALDAHAWAVFYPWYHETLRRGGFRNIRGNIRGHIFICHWV